jgi:hypothetical protein
VRAVFADWNALELGGILDQQGVGNFTFSYQVEHNSGIACCMTQIIKHNSGITCCAVGNKLDHHDSPLKNVAVANLLDRICALSPCILRVRNVTFLTNFHPTFFLHTVLDVVYGINFLTLYP